MRNLLHKKWLKSDKTLHLPYHNPVFCLRWTSSSFTETCALNIHWPQSSRGPPGSRLQSCVLWQGYISATPKEGIRLVEVMDVWARLCTISQINDSLMVWEISKLHRQATHFSCFFLLSFGPWSCGEPRVCWRKYGVCLRNRGWDNKTAGKIRNVHNFLQEICWLSRDIRLFLWSLCGVCFWRSGL